MSPAEPSLIPRSDTKTFFDQITMKRLSQLSLCVGAITLLLVLGSGCGYMVGQPYNPTVRTVEVPIFETSSHRRGLDTQLTEAVQKQIQLRTPFRLVKDGGDTKLSGRIVDLRKSVLGETRFDDPRELQINLVLDVVWEDTRSGKVLAQEQYSLAPELVALRSQADFAPEVGQSLATALQQSINQMARQIVGLMESPW